MTKIKKITVGFMMAMLIMVAGVVSVFAEEGTENDIYVFRFPYASFGISVEDFKNSNSFHDEQQNDINPVMKRNTLSDGSTVILLSYNGTSDYDTHADYTFCFLDDKLVAQIMDVINPEGLTYERIREGLITQYGEPYPLDLSALGLIQEIIGEKAQLEDGQEAWDYMAEPNVWTAYSEGLEESAGQDISMSSSEIPATGTIRMQDDHVLMSLFTDPSSSVQSVSEWTIRLSDLQGTDDLTTEELQEVSEYMNYLEYQMKLEAQQYIEYTRQKHSDQ